MDLYDPFYDKTKVTGLYGLDPADQMHRLARKRIRESGIDVRLLTVSAEQIPQPAGSLDTVLILTFP